MQCYECGGLRVVLVHDFDAMTAHEREVTEEFLEQKDRERAERASELRFGY